MGTALIAGPDGTDLSPNYTFEGVMTRVKDLLNRAANAGNTNVLRMNHLAPHQSLALTVSQAILVKYQDGSGLFEYKRELQKILEDVFHDIYADAGLLLSDDEMDAEIERYFVHYASVNDILDGALPEDQQKVLVKGLRASYDVWLADENQQKLRDLVDYHLN